MSLQLIIDTPTSPITSGLPLFFVITVTAVKQVRTTGFHSALFFTGTEVNCDVIPPLSLAVRVTRTG